MIRPEYGEFIEQYRALLHSECHPEADALADWLDGELRDLWAQGCDDPERIRGWDCFMLLLRSGTPLEYKLWAYPAALGGLWPEEVQQA